MATSLPPGAARAGISLDLSALQAAPNVARAAGQAVSRELQATMRAAANAQKLAITQAKTALAEARALERGASATAKAESQVRILAARAEAAAKIEAERRVTAEFKTQLRERVAAERRAAAQASGGLAGGVARGIGQFATGAAGALVPLGAAALGAAVGGAAIRGGIDAAREAAFAERAATAFDKLSGSAGVAAARLRAVQQGAAGTLSRFEAMRIGVQATALGLAETSEQFGQLASAARAVTFVSPVITDISSAISEIALASANMSWRRLDQLGLTVTEVRAKMEELRQTQTGLNENQLFAQAVISTLNTKYGELVKTGGDAASSFEKAAAAWKDARLEFGAAIAPTAAEFLNGLTDAVNGLTVALKDLRESDFVRVLREAREAFGVGRERALGIGPRTARQGANIRGGVPLRGRPASATPAGRTFTDDQTAAIRDWAEGVQAIERNAANARLEATRSYEQQRNRTIEQFAVANQREEEDFQRGRLRAAMDLAADIARIGRDAAEREGEWALDLDQRVGKIRRDSAERIAELEADYAKQRERRERDHRDRLMDAAARLDAAAVFEEQRNFARESKDADDDHKQRLAKERTQLAERVEQENDAHLERVERARKADRRRIEEMQAALDEQQRREDEDRAIRKQRQAEDHARQLADMAQAHQERLAQIDRQLAEERRAHHDAFQKRLEELGLYNEAWKQLQKAREEAALKSFDKWWEAINKRFEAAAQAAEREERSRQSGGAFGPYRSQYATGGWVRRTEPALVHRGEFVLSREMVAAAMRPASMGGNTTNNRSIRVDAGAIVVNAAPGQSAQDVAAAVDARLMAHLERWAA